MTAKCGNHKPVQHRDGKPPWCNECKLTAEFTEPVRRHSIEGDIYKAYDGEFVVGNIETYPALVISTTVDAGRNYAEILGLKNYVVSNSMDKIQGLRIRAIVVTPGTIQEWERTRHNAMGAYTNAMYNLALTNEEWG